jgi:DNA-binding NtrC family response regulator
MPGGISTYLAPQGEPGDDGSAPAPAAGTQASAAPRSILIVDDEVDLLVLVAQLFEMAGLEVQTAESGEEALARLQQRRFDVLLTDVVMGGMNGFVLAEQASAADPAMQVFVASGFSHHPAFTDAAQRTSFTFLSKPYSVAQVLARLHH